MNRTFASPDLRASRVQPRVSKSGSMVIVSLFDKYRKGMKMLASLSYSMLSFSKAPLKTSFSSKLTSTIKKEDLRLVRRRFLF